MSSTYCNGTGIGEVSQPVATGSVGMAFLLVVIAGLSTTIGSTMACCMRPHHTHWLAIALGLSAGVMIYVSFVEIFSTKAVSAFESTMDSGKAYATATSLFFAGIVCTGILDWFVHYLMHRGRKAALSVSSQHVTTREDVPNMPVGQSPVSFINNDCCNGIICNHDTTSFSPSASVRVNFHLDEHHIDTTIWYDGQTNDINLDTPTTSSTLDLNGPTICPPSTTTDTNIVPHRCSPSAPHSTNIHSHTNPVSPPQDHSGCVCMHDLDVILAQAEQRDAKDKPHGHVRDSTPPLDDQHKLSQMSFMTGFALALHNFPEGIATFVAALADPTLGVALCVAISLHNIPEGICVSMPVYYATGSRKKAFLYSFLSGVSEPVGAAVGYLALRNVLSDLVYGILFSVVAGMMIYISFKELLPTARRYDSSDRYVTTATFVGMAAMAVSLVMFAL